MQFTRKSSKIINSIVPYIKEVGAYPLLKNDEKFKKSLESLFMILYKEILDSEMYIRRYFCHLPKPELTNNLLQTSLYGGPFVPSNIKKHIDKYLQHQLIYTVKVRDKDVKIIFGMFSEAEIENISVYNKYVIYIIRVLNMFYKFSSKQCSKSIRIFMYLTPFKKTISENEGEILGPSHVNTGVTYHCAENNDMFIYRREEWKKVFIHEAFHSCGFDFIDRNASSIQNYIKSIYPVNSKFLIGEAYVETWARILLSAFNSFDSLETINDKSGFNIYMNFSLQCERIFSILQMNKVLENMNMTYDDLTNIDDMRCQSLRNMYNENSNVLSYYIVTALFINDYHKFLLWCVKNNTSLFRFSTSDYTVNSFIRFMKEAYSSPNFKRTIEYMSEHKIKKSKYLQDTLRMSAVEISD